MIQAQGAGVICVKLHIATLSLTAFYCPAGGW